MHAHATSDDRGETLVEVLVAIGILGIAAVAVLGSVLLGIKVSDIHRKTTDAAAGVRNYVEAIEDYVANTVGGYASCVGQSQNHYTPGLVGYHLPPGWTAMQGKPVSVDGAGTAATTCAADTGVQQFTVTVNSNDGRGSETLTVVLRKPCSFRWSDVPTSAPDPTAYATAHGGCS